VTKGGKRGERFWVSGTKVGSGGIFREFGGTSREISKLKRDAPDQKQASVRRGCFCNWARDKIPGQGEQLGDSPGGDSSRKVISEKKGPKKSGAKTFKLGTDPILPEL